MILSEPQKTEMLEAAKPLIKWMNENCHPHCEAKVDQNSVELTEGIAYEITHEYVKG